MVDKFLLVGLKADLPAVRDANKLYWCSDTRELYKGMDLYTEAVRIVSAVPATPAQGVLYVLPTGEAKVFNGTDTVTVAKPYVDSSAGVLTAANTDDQVATAKAVYDSIVDAVSSATEDIVKGGALVNNIISTKAGTVTVTKGEYLQLDAGNATFTAGTNYFVKSGDAYVVDTTVDSSNFAAKVASGLYVSADETDIVLKGVVVNPTYDNTTRTITLPYADGTDSLVISLGKDIFVDPDADNKYNATTGNIELFLNDGSMSYEAIEIKNGDSSDGSLSGNFFKITASAIYREYLRAGYFIYNDSTSKFESVQVTANTFVEKVESGLWVLEYDFEELYRNVSEIYLVASGDSEYQKIYTTNGLYTTIDNNKHLGTLYFGVNSHTMISIPASSLVDVYTGATSADGSTTVSVSADNKITASVNVSADPGNKLVKKADGLYVDAVDQADFDALDTQVNSVQTQVVLKQAGTTTGASYTYSADDKFLVDGVETTIASDADLNTKLADTGVTSVVAVVGEDGIAARLTTAEADIDQIQQDIAGLADVHVDAAADNKYDNTTGMIYLYLNDGDPAQSTQPTKIEVPVAELKAAVAAIDTINTTLKDGIYVEVASTDKFDVNTTYFVLSNGEFVEDNTVSAANFDAKVAAGLYVIASDAIELLAAKVDANAAAIKQNADDIEAVSYTKCTTNTVYNPAIPYYTVDSDGKYVVDSSVISAATYETAVATGKCYTKTTDAIVENEGRIAAIENALTWGTF